MEQRFLAPDRLRPLRPVGPADQTVQHHRIGDRAPTVNTIRYSFDVTTVEKIGTAVNTAFPSVLSVATYEFKQNAAVVGINLSSSITNLDTALAGIFVLVQESNVTTRKLDGVSPIIVGHTTYKNATATAPVSANRSSGVAFGDFTAYHFNQGEKLGIFMCAANTAGNLLMATVQVIFIPVSGNIYQ
jgi:hypothetical protein